VEIESKAAVTRRVTAKLRVFVFMAIPAFLW